MAKPIVMEWNHGMDDMPETSNRAAMPSLREDDRAALHRLLHRRTGLSLPTVPSAEKPQATNKHVSWSLPYRALSPPGAVQTAESSALTYETPAANTNNFQQERYLSHRPLWNRVFSPVPALGQASCYSLPYRPGATSILNNERSGGSPVAWNVDTCPACTSSHSFLLLPGSNTNGSAAGATPPTPLPSIWFCPGVQRTRIAEPVLVTPQEGLNLRAVFEQRFHLSRADRERKVDFINPQIKQLMLKMKFSPDEAARLYRRALWVPKFAEAKRKGRLPFFDMRDFPRDEFRADVESDMFLAGGDSVKKTGVGEASVPARNNFWQVLSEDDLVELYGVRSRELLSLCQASNEYWQTLTSYFFMQLIMQPSDYVNVLGDAVIKLREAAEKYQNTKVRSVSYSHERDWCMKVLKERLDSVW